MLPIRAMETDTQYLITYPKGRLKERFYIEGALLIYAGDLGSDRGTDLLLESFAMALPSVTTAHLVVIGGTREDIQHYRGKAEQCGIDDAVHFIGSKPAEQLQQYLGQADVVVSPHIRSDRLPTNFEAYLSSGRALLATALPTHIRRLGSETALLAEPNAASFAEAMIQLSAHPEVRDRLSRAARTAYVT